VDELAAYLAYALKILKNCDLPCEGVTTPGGFGNLVKTELSLAVHEAVRDVYGAPLPHYFKYVSDGSESTEPSLEHVRGLETDDPRVTVNVPAGTGDWFGGWDGDRAPEGHRYANHDATEGRMVELIEQGRPAIMLCHWPGMYTHGSKQGYHAFQKVVRALNGRFGDRTVWMKISEIARYWAAKELTRIERSGNRLTLTAPFASPRFTLRLAARDDAVPQLAHRTTRIPLAEVARPQDLQPGKWLRERGHVTICFDLPRGEITLRV
jgi:hypothetical protein